MVMATWRTITSGGELAGSITGTGMFIQASRKYFARSIALERTVASWVASGFRSRRPSAPGGHNNLDVLRHRLEAAECRVAQCERLVAGWREVIDSEQSAVHEVAVARDLLKTFENGLEVAMSDRKDAEAALGKHLLDIFEGARGRLPQNDQELQEWLASPEGKAATAFEPTSASRWGEVGRS